MKFIKLLLIIAVVSGLMYGTFLISGHSSGESSESKPIASDEDNPTDTTEVTLDDMISDRIAIYMLDLEDEAITFDEIKDMHTWITENAASLNDQNGGNHFNKKIDAYIEVINCVEPQDRTWKKIRDVVTMNRSLINGPHLNHLQSIWIKGYNSCGEAVLLNASEMHIINAKLKALNEIKSFKDIPSSREMLTQNLHQARPAPTDVFRER
jgi:hypothetical protein